MSNLLKCCPECGQLSETTYCAAHTKKPQDTRTNHRPDTKKASWTKLSKQARKQQPFCTKCGTTQNLQADHSPRAWARYRQHLPLRLTDITVLCGKCNSQAGSSQPGSQRYSQWQQEDGDIKATRPDNTWGHKVNPPTQEP